jgi:hypothetical protein
MVMSTLCRFSDAGRRSGLPVDIERTILISWYDAHRMSRSTPSDGTFKFTDACERMLVSGDNNSIIQSN